MFLFAMLGTSVLVGISSMIVALNASNADVSLGLFLSFIGLLAQFFLGMFTQLHLRGEEPVSDI